MKMFYYYFSNVTNTSVTNFFTHWKLGEIYRNGGILFKSINEQSKIVWVNKVLNIEPKLQ